ncbi:hypothetical protein Tco_0326034, partial [Tanacetum coccineum]
HPLSPAYVPDPMELDEHAPLYVPDHPEHHDSSEENMPVEDQSDAEDTNSHGFLADSDSMEDDTDAESRPKSKNAKVRINTEESAVKPEPKLKNTIGCNLNPSDGP